MKKAASKTTVSAVVWLLGLMLCVLFVGLLIPWEGTPGHQWIMPIGPKGFCFFSGVCFIILLGTYFLDRFLTRK
jgi:hypothetical protein